MPPYLRSLLDDINISYPGLYSHSNRVHQGLVEVNDNTIHTDPQIEEEEDQETDIEIEKDLHYALPKLISHERDNIYEMNNQGLH